MLSVKPNITESHKNIKQCHSSLQIFVWEIFISHKNVLFMVTYSGFITLKLMHIYNFLTFNFYNCEY